LKLLDTSVIILFADFIFDWNCISHLYDIGEDLNTTPEVHQEYYQKSEAWMSEDLVKLFINQNKLKVLDINLTNSKDNFKNRFPKLNDGELSILSLGSLLKSENKSYYCVLDDKHARNAAKSMNLNLTGSIGMIEKIKFSNIWNDQELENIVNDINQSPFFVSEEILRVLINE